MARIESKRHYKIGRKNREADWIRLMEEKDVEQVEELEKQCFSISVVWYHIKDGLTGQVVTCWYGKKTGS